MSNDSNKIFNPWDKAIGRERDSDISDLVSESPCRRCEYFKPMTEDDPDEENRGVVLCHSSKQYNDFSCFKWNGFTEVEYTKENYEKLSKYTLELEETNERYKKLLKCAEFYADKNNWHKDSQEYGSSVSTFWQITGKDLYEQNEATQYGGRLARQILEEIK